MTVRCAGRADGGTVNPRRRRARPLVILAILALVSPRAKADTCSKACQEEIAELRKEVAELRRQLERLDSDLRGQLKGVAAFQRDVEKAADFSTPRGVTLKAPLCLGSTCRSTWPALVLGEPTSTPLRSLSVESEATCGASAFTFAWHYEKRTDDYLLRCRTIRLE
jgi:hypothetical protein